MNENLYVWISKRDAKKLICTEAAFFKKRIRVDVACLTSASQSHWLLV